MVYIEDKLINIASSSGMQYIQSLRPFQKAVGTPQRMFDTVMVIWALVYGKGFEVADVERLSPACSPP